MKIRHQNAWPSLNHDIYSAIQRIERLMPVGFYYRTFIHFPIEWRRLEGTIRRIAGVGSLQQELSRWRNGGEMPHFDRDHLHAELVVVGGGPAGTYSALEAARAGMRVVLVDDQESLGGHLRFTSGSAELSTLTGLSQYSGLPGYELAKKLDESARTQKNLKILNNATAFGLYESNLVGVARGNQLIKVRAKQVIVATGGYEHLTLFENNDLPGILLGTAVQRLILLYGVRPGKAAAVVTNNPSGLAVARDLVGAGVDVVALIDSRTEVETGPLDYGFLTEAGVPVLQGFALEKAVGRKKVEGVVAVRLDERGEPIRGTEQSFRCDTVCLSNGLEPDVSLLAQLKCDLSYDETVGAFVAKGHPPSVRPVGDITGMHDLGHTLAQAGAAALASLVDVRADVDDRLKRRLADFTSIRDGLERAYRERLAGRRPANTMAIPRLDPRGRMKGIVCFCEDVPEKDLVRAAAEGFTDIETLKRFSTYTMGPCEGKMCSTLGAAVCARETGRSLSETGRTAARPPYLPVRLGTVAGGELHPVRLTPMHYKHLESGAAMMDMGEWKRPHVYSSVEEEYHAVREGVGIIDLSTLGRLDVKGKDAATLLDLVYTHSMSKLQPGRSRYGVICDDAGVILDDGTVTRLSDDHYFVTTSTGNIDFVEQWLTWWATTKRYDAHVTNLTSGFAAVNVAGPKARDLLKRLTTIDLSSDKFPYMGSGSGLVAGVPCILLRIGFVGETGWEIHFPAEYGEYFWDALLDAGKEFGVLPFGVEAQRVLRLDKKHVIVGQDTDALSTPYEADMAWVVKLDKQDFIGKAALAFCKDEVSLRKLVGFVMQGTAIPHDGDQAFSSDGRILIGTVTSSRLSPTVGKGVGLALISSEIAKEGEIIIIKSQGVPNEAKLTFIPFYDPEGKRLKA